jgi:hypothetical protein
MAEDRPWPLRRPADWLEIVNCPQSEADLNALGYGRK